MFLYTLLSLIFVMTLSSSLASKRKSFPFNDVIKTNEQVKDERRELQTTATRSIDSTGIKSVNMLGRHAAVITDGRTKNLKLIHRRKRGWASVIFTGVTSAVQLAGIGLTLTQALSEGCAFFPSICRNKKRMAHLERRLESMRSEYDKLYLENKKEYLNIQTANTNNAYISYYINGTLQHIYTLEKLELILTESLESRYPKLHSMYEGSKYYTSEEYLDSKIGHLEHRLSDIRDMLKKEKKTRLKWLIIQSLVQVTVTRFISSFSDAYDEVIKAEKDKIKTNTPKTQPTVPKLNPENKTPKPKGKFKLVKKMFKQVIKAKDKLLKFKSKAVKYTKRFGKTMKNMITSPIKKLRAIIDPEYRQKIMKNANLQNTALQSTTAKVDKKTTSLQDKVRKYNVGKMEVAMGVIGIIADIATQVMATLGWKGVAKDVEKARINYEKHYRKFLKELNEVKNEKVQLTDSWSDVINIFKNSSSVIEQLMESARNYTNFNAILGLSKLPIDTNDPIFDINFKILNSTNTQSAQEKVINFIKELDNDVLRVVDQMYARKVMYEKILTMTDYKSSVDNIFQSITGIYEFSTSVIIKEFGTKLTKKDLMCTLSLLRPDLLTYDFFQLDVFRPECNISKSAYKETEENAVTQRNKNLMNVIVKKELMTNKTLPTLIDLTAFVKNAYLAKDNTEMSSYGDRLTEKDVICTIAKQFPSKQEFDFINLIPFRPDCEMVNEKDFLIMKTKAETVKGISLQIKSVLNTCKSFKLCPCPSMIVMMFQISKDQVINLIRLQAPEMETYCGTTGCSCVQLK